jgi:ferredoxin-NADP reductase/Ca2+-binding EF-hand superfamily protein
MSAPGEDKKLVAMLERAFAHHAGKDVQIDLTELKAALGLKSEYLARAVMRALDRNSDGVIQKDEFLAGVRALVAGTDRDKLFFAFRVHDEDGDGAIGRDEMLRMIAVSLGESEVIERATQSPEILTRTLFALADKNRDGRISFEELEAAVRTHPKLLHQMTRNEAIWVLPNESLLAWVDARTATGTGPWLEKGVLPWVVLALFAVANGAIFAWQMIRPAAVEAQNPAMGIGRALGTCIDFNGALILVPMMRRLLTRVRATWLGRIVPVDDAIDFHKVVGHTLFALAVAHSAAFLLAYRVGHATSPIAHALLTSRGLSGGILLAIFGAMWIFSLRFIRRTSRFELFYFTHLLYVAWLALAIVHAPRFLFWAGVPIVGFAIEQLLRLRRRGPPSAVLEGSALRSGVTRLEIARPPGFTFDPGDYVFLRIPKIAKHEWHPFTISSAPEKEALAFHVRSLGNWTGALRRRIEANADTSDLVAHVDGPYGSPSAHIFDARFAVLIGAGIGVTPFASLLESFVLRENSERPPRLERMHFFWLNRDQYSFEWFTALLSELERQDLKHLLEVHLCMTGGRAGATALGLELAREAMHSSGRSDLITGLRTHTHMGPPDWEAMLGTIARRHAPAKVDVFFCGPPGLARKLRHVCDRLGMSFREERF